MIHHEKKMILGATLLACIFVALAFFIKASSTKNSNPHQYDLFAQCLTKASVVMYGAAWCPHCQATKAAFADSFKFVTYVECVNNSTLCAKKGVDAYPTWLIGTTSKIEGFDSNTFHYLSTATGCALPQ